MPLLVTVASVERGRQRQTDRQKSDFRSESVPLTTFPTQTQQPNNKLYSTHQREGERKDRGDRCFQPTDESFREAFLKCHKNKA